MEKYVKFAGGLSSVHQFLEELGQALSGSVVD